MKINSITHGKEAQMSSVFHIITVEDAIYDSIANSISPNNTTPPSSSRLAPEIGSEL